MPQAAFAMPADHPCLDGHFPGRPLVPGVALLDALAAQAGRLAGLETVRFLTPVTPGETVILAWTQGEGGRIDFTGHVHGRLVFRGRARAAAG